MVIIQLIINKTCRNKYYICKDGNKGHKQTTIRYCKPTEHAPEGSVARVASDVSCRPDNFYKIVRIYIKIEGCLKIN